MHLAWFSSCKGWVVGHVGLSFLCTELNDYTTGPTLKWNLSRTGILEPKRWNLWKYFSFCSSHKTTNGLFRSLKFLYVPPSPTSFSFSMKAILRMLVYFATKQSFWLSGNHSTQECTLTDLLFSALLFIITSNRDWGKGSNKWQHNATGPRSLQESQKSQWYFLCLLTRGKSIQEIQSFY